MGTNGTHITDGAFHPERMHRRHFQKMAAQTFDHHTEAIVKTREALADVSLRLDTAEATSAAHRSELTLDQQALSQRIDTFVKLGFIGRMRWLFTGEAR